MKKVSEKRAVNLPKLSGPQLSSDGNDSPITPRRPPRLQLDQAPSDGLTSIGLDTMASPTKSSIISPTTPSKQVKPQSLRTRKLEDQTSAFGAQVYDPNSSALLNPAYEIDMGFLEAEVDKMKQLGQAAESHVEAIYANNAKERQFFKQASSEIATLETDIINRQRLITHEKQAWASEKIEYESLLTLKENERLANEKERSKLSDTLTQTMQYFTHEIEQRDVSILAQQAELQTTREVLGSTENSLRQSQLQLQRTTDTLAKHVDELDQTRKELADCRDVLAQHEITISNQSKHILSSEAALNQARASIASLESRCGDQKGTLHAYKEEMHGYAYNIDQLRRDVKLAQEKQDELQGVIKGHEKTITSFKKLQAKWDAAKVAFEAEQAEHRSMSKMYKERIDSQAKLIHRQEEAIVSNTVTQMADFTTIDMQNAQLKTLNRTVEEQATYITKLETTCRAAEIQHLKNRSLIELLQTKIHGMEEVSGHQDREISTLNERLTKRDGVVAAREAEIESLKQRYDGMSKELMGQVETNQAAIAVHIGVIEAMRVEHEALQVVKNQLETDLSIEIQAKTEAHEKICSMRQELATGEDNYINLSLKRGMEEAVYSSERRSLITWARMIIEEQSMAILEKDVNLQDAQECSARRFAALTEILEETKASFEGCKVQLAETIKDYDVKVQERTEALEQQEERIHLLEIQLKMNAEQAMQRRQTAHEERQREMTQFQLQLKGKEDVFEIELARLKAQIQQERTTALEENTALQEKYDLDISKVHSTLQQERAASVTTIAALNETITTQQLAHATLREEYLELQDLSRRERALALDRVGMLDEELRGCDRALQKASAHEAKLHLDHAAYLARLKEEHSAFVMNVRDEHENFVKNLQAQHTEESTRQETLLREVTAQHERENSELVAKHEADTTTREEETTRQRLELEAKLQYQKESLTGQMKNMKTEYEAQLVEQRVRLECLIEHQRETLEGQLRDQKADAEAQDSLQRKNHESAIKNQREELESELAKQHQGYESVISQQRERYEVTIRQRKERYELDILNQRTELEGQLAHVKSKLEGELADQTQRLTLELTTTKGHLESELEMQKSFYESTLQQSRDKYEREAADSTSSYEKKLIHIQTTLEDELAAQKELLETQIKTQRENFENEIALQRSQLENQLETQRVALETDITSQREALESDLQRQKAEYEDELLRQRTELDDLLRAEKEAHEFDVTRLDTACRDVKEALERELADQKLQSESQFNSMKSDLEARLKSLQEKYDTDMQTQKEAFEIAMDALREELNLQMTTQKKTHEDAIALQKQELEALLSSQKESYDISLTSQCNRYDQDMAIERQRYDDDMKRQRESYELELIQQRERLGNDMENLRQELENQLKALVQTSEHDRAAAKKDIDELETRAKETETSLVQQRDGLYTELRSCQEKLREIQQDHASLHATHVEFVVKHDEASENYETTKAQLNENIATLEAQLAQSYTGEFILARVKAAVSPLIRENYHPKMLGFCMNMATLDDLETLIKCLLDLSIDCQQHVQIDQQRLSIDEIKQVVYEHDELWNKLAEVSCVKNITNVIQMVYDMDKLMRKASDVVPDLIDTTAESIAIVIETYQAIRNEAASIFHKNQYMTQTEILAALSEWQSCRTNCARALRLQELVCSEIQIIGFIDEYMELRDKTCHRLQLNDVNAAIIYDHLETYQSCLTQSKVILASEAPVDTATLLAQLDEYGQLRRHVAAVSNMTKEQVDAAYMLASIQELCKLRNNIQRTTRMTNLPTGEAIHKVVEEYETLRTSVADVWNEPDPTTANRILQSIQELHEFRLSASIALSVPPAALVLGQVVKQLQEYVTLREAGAKHLSLSEKLAPPRDIADAIEAYQKLRLECSRVWAMGEPSKEPKNPKEILQWVQELHGLRSRVSILLGRESICTAEDIVQAVEMYLDLTEKHRFLVRTKMTIEANNNALQGSLDASRQALQDYELRMASLGSKHGCPFQATTAAVFFENLDRKIQDGKEFEVAFHRRKQLHEQDSQQHAIAIENLQRESALSLEAVHRDHSLKLQDLERASTQELASLSRKNAMEIEDLKADSERKLADLERSSTGRVDELQRELTNIRALKLKEQEDYDATMDKIRRALEIQATEMIGRKDQGDKAAYFARYVERDRMLMELVYGSIRSVTQLLTPPKSSFVMPTELSHGILGCIKELKRMKEYVMGSFDALQKEVTPFLPFEIQWFAAEWRGDMDVAEWYVESVERTNEYARMQFQLFLAQANTTWTMLAGTQRDRALDVLAFMRRNVLQDEAIQEKDMCMLKMRLMDAITDRDQVSMELQLKETFFQDLLHQHKTISNDMLSRLQQQQQLLKNIAQGPPTTPKPVPFKSSADMTIQKPSPRPKWQEEDQTTLIPSNGRTLKERFVSDLAFETGQNPTSTKRGLPTHGAKPSQFTPHPQVSVKDSRLKDPKVPVWYQGVRQVQGNALSISIAINQSHDGLVVDIFNSDTEKMQVLELSSLSPLLLAKSQEKSLTTWNQMERNEVVDSILTRLRAIVGEDGVVLISIDDT